MQPTKTQKISLPSLSDSKLLRKQITRLIKNKIQPLSFKHFVLKSGNYSQKFQQPSIDHSIKTKQDCSLSIKKKDRISNHSNKENAQHSSGGKKNRNRRRQALIEIGHSLNRQHYQDLQAKVQQHIMLKRMNIMEDQYTYAEQCNKKDKMKMCNKLRSSPLSKFIGLFERSELPSQKIKRIDETSCEQMLKQIKSAKSIKHIEFMEENVRGLWNQDKKSLSHKQKKHETEQISGKIQQRNKKLKEQIMTDIKKQYQNQGSCKIRISINHKKMIQIV